MRHSLSGTDISDEGNHSLSDIEDDLDNDHHLRHLRHGTSTNSNSASRTNSNNNYSHHRVSFQGASSSAKGTTSGGTTSRPKDDLKAIARHQAELSLHQKPHEGGDDLQYGLNDNNDDNVHVPTMPHMPAPPPPVLSNFGSHIIVNDGEDEDDDDEDWDVQSDSGAPSSSLMYSADVREPSCRSTLALPMSTPSNNKAYLKKPSIANLNGSIRSRQRCLSLPADTVPPGKGGFLKMSSKSSENWDEDFDIESTDIHVPTKVVENQMSLQMDLYNIKDFASQIEDLKTLRASLRMASSSLKATNPTKHQHLSVLFQRDWEQAEVIIDLGEIAQTSGPTTPTSASSSSQGASLSLQHSDKKASEPSLATLSTKPSGGFKPRRPVFSTSAPANNNNNNINNSNNNPLDALSAYQVRSESQSSNMTGATFVAETGCGDDESDGTAASTRTSSRASSSVSASGSGLKVDIEAAVEKLAVSQATTTSSVASPTTARDSEKGMRKASMAFMKESCSSPAGLGLCTSPMTPLRTTLKGNDNDYDDEDYDDYHGGDLEIKYDTDSIGLLRFPDGEQPFKGGFHEKEDSSATVKPLSPRSPRESGGAAFPVDVEASLRRYQKYSHYSKRRTTGGLPSSSRRLPADDVYTHEDDDDEDEEDDGYESYGHGDGSSSSIGIFTPIPSDRHMQVLKDILMEGLGTEVARQYMFKQGEQDHVRFSVEVIPGLLGHLKGLQQRLGDQLQQLTVIV
ncbi:hypothetical protein BGX24_003581 [Mortierella sp. AD032]|nr:hypothetical protein BGX24_003581 [Mortierella sp. AD032]